MQFNAIDINSLFFKQVYQYALENYPQALAYLGIAPEKFNIENFLNKYFQTQFIQDISSDPTANVEGKSIARFKAELGIPFMKYIVFKTLFDKMVEMYGIEVAKILARNLFNGIFYLHDSAHLSCYCLGVDLSKLLFDGINWGYLHSLPPKKPRTFINQVKEVVIELSHEWAGAIGLPCLIILYTYIYCKYYGIEKEINKKEVIDDFQNLVHTLNRELRAAFQSPFTNISYFDRYCLDEIMEYVYSWMLSENGWDKETFIEKVMKVQEIVMEFLSKGDPKTGSLYRFPVQTVNLTKDKKGNIRDKEFLKIVCKYNTKGQMNIYVSDNVERFSFCCRYQSSVKDIKFDSFGNGGINVGCYDDKTEILTNNGWKLFKDLNEDDLVLTLNMQTKKAEFQKPTHYFEYNYDGIMHHYKTRDIDLLVTPNHNMLLVSRKTGKLELKRSDDFGTGYNLPVAGFPINKESIKYIKIGCREYESKNFCKLVGFFIADGACYLNDDVAEKHAWEVRFCVSKLRKINFLENILNELGLKYCKYFNHKSNVYVFCIYGGKELHKFFRKFYTEENKKCINKEFMLSLGKEELEALFKGLIEGDGHKLSNVDSIIYYTSSDELKDDFCMLCSLIGYQTTVRYKGNPRHRIIFFKKENRKVYGKCYEIVVRRVAFVHKLSKYRKEVYYKGKIYCVEVPNHVLMVRRNGKTAWCGNSIHITTINLNRIALDVKIKSSKENKDNLKNNFISLLLLRMFEAKKILDAFREVLRDKIKQGFYKFFNLKWFDLDKHFFSTIGFVGLYEAMETLGLNIKDKFAVEVMQTMDKVIEDFNKNGKGIMYNLEQIPGEGACAILPKIDKLFYGEENVPYVLYANQFIPLYVEHSILDKIEIEGKFFKYCSGGAISHINIMHELKPEEVEKMIKMVVKAGIEHFALNPVFSICENNHYIIGKVEKCPICNAKIKDWLTRVVGFFTKVSTWQKDRRDWEFNKRIWFDLS